MSGAVKATHEPYAPIEKAAVAAGIKHLMDKCNASAMPQGTKGNRHDIIAARESPAGGTARDAVASEAPGARTQQ